MPTIFQNTSRRHFLRLMAGTTGAIATIGVFASFSPDQDKDLKLALISDTHIPEDKTNNYRGFYPYKNLEIIVPQIAATELSGTIITGDLARLTGEPGDYANLKALLEPLAGKMPVAMAMGNHDRRDHFLDAFPSNPGERQNVRNKYILVLEHPSVRLVLLDSLIYTNLSPALGLLGKEQRYWLSEFLKTNEDKPIILFFHHSLGDGDSDLQDIDRLFGLIRPHKQVKAIFYGHSHVYNFSEHEGIHLINLPASGYNFRDHDPVGWVEASFSSTEGNFKLHSIGGNMKGDGISKKLTWRK